MPDKYHDPLDSLLAQQLVTPPHDFSDRVVGKIATQPPMRSVTGSAKSSFLNKLLTSLALAAGTVAGGFQILGFIFGMWIPATVG